MLINSKDILIAAKAGNYAVPAPDYIDLDSARTFVHVAQQLNKPVILSYAQAFQSFISLEEAAAIGKVVAESVDVPVVLHIDHGTDIPFIEKAIDLGFTSVMIDASMDSFEENVRKTKAVVAFAHPRGVTVEAEIGHVGMGGSYGENHQTDSIYTEVEEAVAFCQQTQVDALAVSIGTIHGIYKNLKSPVLNFERLKDLTHALPVPLVLHGGSGTGDDNLHKCATEGISKINIYTDFLVSAMQEIKAQTPNDYLALKKAANEGMAQTLRHYYQVFSNEAGGLV